MVRPEFGGQIWFKLENNSAHGISGRGAFSYSRNIEKIQKTLEDAGVIFIHRNEDGGPGVRLK